MRLSAARPADQDEIGAAFDPTVPCADGHDVGLGDHRHRIEVEAVEVFARQQSGLSQMALDPPSVAFGDLVLGERGQEACSRPSLLVGLFGDSRPAVLYGRQAQIVEDQLEPRDIDGLVHAATSSGLESRIS